LLSSNHGVDVQVACLELAKVEIRPMGEVIALKSQ
jgi:hypothetical protein